VAVLGCDLLGEAADQHAPAGTGAAVDLVDLERDVRVVRREQFRADRHPHDDHVAAGGPA